MAAQEHRASPFLVAAITAIIMAMIVVMVVAAIATTSAASPIFNGTAPNVWILQSDGTTSAEYNVGGSAWTTSASFGPGSIDVFYGGSSLTVTNVSGVTALVNLTQASDPPLDPALPQLSLVGLSEQLSNMADLSQPGVAITPVSGTYNETIRVTVNAVSAPNGTGVLDAFYQIGADPPSPAGQGAEVSFFLVANDTYNVNYWSMHGAVSSPVKLATFTIDNTDLRRDSDGDGVPDRVEAANGLDPLVSDLKPMLAVVTISWPSTAIEAESASRMRPATRPASSFDEILVRRTANSSPPRRETSDSSPGRPQSTTSVGRTLSTMTSPTA